jgi:hypothetical protein
MIKVLVKDRSPDRSYFREFFYTHTAKTWLLLSGYLPLSAEEDGEDQIYVNHYTGSTAKIRGTK